MPWRTIYSRPKTTFLNTDDTVANLPCLMFEHGIRWSIITSVHEIPDADNLAYRFFKVKVEMP